MIMRLPNLRIDSDVRQTLVEGTAMVLVPTAIGLLSKHIFNYDSRDFYPNFSLALVLGIANLARGFIADIKNEKAPNILRALQSLLLASNSWMIPAVLEYEKNFLQNSNGINPLNALGLAAISGLDLLFTYALQAPTGPQKDI